ncbi:MAG: DUF1566 domain-containing protein [Candidatus Magnetoovum sp. WYHC-5]|nr:DUF1566 domain-containing protein [Candidatus Magnetoovum sp. WYHC-5]
MGTQIVEYYKIVPDGLKWKKNGIIFYSKAALEAAEQEKKAALETAGMVDNGDGTVTDKQTGLMLAKDASTPTVGSCEGGLMHWDEAHKYIKCLNSANYLRHNDWKLPTKEQWESLVKSKEDVKNLKKIFSGMQSWYWSSTTDADSTSSAWYVSMGLGYVDDDDMSGLNYVWPVRLGQ